MKSGAALAAVTNFEHAWYSGAGKFLLSSGPGWLAISWDGLEKFRLETSKYHGRPALWRDKADNRVSFGLSDARFAGTDLTADLTCEIWPGAFGLQTLIQFETLGLAFRGYVRDWLTEEGLFSYLPSAFELLRTRHIALSLKPCDAQLTTGGTLCFHGTSCASLEILGTTLRSDSLSVGLPSEASLLSNPAARRTRVVVERGDHHWPVIPIAGRWHHDSSDSSMFDQVELDGSESTTHAIRYGASFSRNHKRSPIAVTLDNAIHGTDGRAPEWFFKRPTYSIQFGSSVRRRMTADLAGVSGLQMGGLALKMRNPVSRPAFTATAVDDQPAAGCVVVEAQLAGILGEDLIFPAHTDKPWHVRVDDGDLPGADVQAQATLGMIDVHPSLDGAVQFRIVRPQDHLDLSFRLTNVTLHSIATNSQVIYPGNNPSGLSLLIADLPPQALLEPVVVSSTPVADDDCKAPQSPTDGSLRSRLSPTSRVSMQLFSDGTGAEQLTAETLLRWAKYPLHIGPSAVAKPSNTSPAPCSSLTEDVTAIEMPAGLIFSPDETHGFYSSDQSRGDQDVYQVWTARLAKRGPDTYPAAPLPTDANHPTARPVFHRDLPIVSPDEFAFTDKERSTIVSKLTTSTSELKHLAVSAVGGWIDASATWEVLPGEDQDMESFRARIAGGLEIVENATYKAYLVPSGHRVSVVKTTQRQWCRDSDGKLRAFFVQRYKILFDEKTRTYSAYMTPGKALGLSVRSITLLGKETLYLDAALARKFIDSCDPAKSFQEYWGEVDLTPGSPTKYAFPVSLEDHTGKSHHTTIPMGIACGNRAWTADYTTPLLAAYEHYNSNPNAGADLGKSRVAYAKPRQHGDTAFPTGRMKFHANPYDVDAALKGGFVPWYPSLLSAELFPDQTASFSVTPPASNLFQYSKLYTSAPFDDDQYKSSPDQSNRAEVLLELIPSKDNLLLDFNGKLGGGLAMPTTQVQALSRRQGAIFSGRAFTDAAGDIQKAADFLNNVGSGLFKVSEAFGDAALLLGAVRLSELLDDISDALAQGAAVPILAARQLRDLEAKLLDQITSLLQPLLSLQTMLQQAIQAVKNKISEIQQNIRAAVQAAVSVFRVSLLEQTPQDVAAVMQSNLPASIPQLTAKLQPKIAQSLQYRIQYSAQLFVTDSGEPCLPTLPQVRDRLFNLALTQTSTVVGPYFQAIDDYLSADVTDMTTQLAAARDAVDKFFSGLESTSLFAIADDLDAVVQAVNQQDLEGLLENIGQLSDDVGSLLNATDEINQFVSQSRDALQQAVKTCANKIQTYVDNFRSTIKSSLPTGLKPGDVQKLVDAITADFTVSAASNALGTVLAAANSALDLASQIDTLVADAQKQINDKLKEADSAIAQALELLSVPKQISVTYDYETPMKSSSVFVASKGNETADLKLHSKFLTNLNGTPPELSVAVTVSNFSLLLLPSSPFISVGFTSASLVSKNGSVPQVNCELDRSSIRFLGPLDFVAKIAESIKLPFGLAVQQLAAGVIISVDLPIHSIESGAFLLTGLSVHCGVHLDFTGLPLRLIFGIASPNRHFIVAYALLGGGGFLQLELIPTPSGTGMTVTSAIEVGAIAALNFGVASGEAHLFAGFYFTMQPDYLLLSGYFRAGGELDVLGLISVCVEFIMSLTYENRGGQAWLSGECDLTVEVDVLFFSTSVSLRMHHDFSGNSSA